MKTSPTCGTLKNVSHALVPPKARRKGKAYLPNQKLIDLTSHRRCKQKISRRRSAEKQHYASKFSHSDTRSGDFHGIPESATDADSHRYPLQHSPSIISVYPQYHRIEPQYNPSTALPAATSLGHDVVPSFGLSPMHHPSRAQVCSGHQPRSSPATLQSSQYPPEYHTNIMRV